MRMRSTAEHIEVCGLLLLTYIQVMPYDYSESADREEWNGKQFKLECTYDMHCTFSTCNMP